MGSTCRSLVSHGTNGLVIDIECHLSNNLPTILIVGYASKTVSESKDRLRGAFASCKLDLPRRRITINLAPADIPKADSGLDLAIASAVMIAAKQIQPLADNTAVIGELSLDGSVRAVRGIIGKLLSGRSHGLVTYFIPSGNLAQAQLVPGLTLFPVNNLRQLYEHLAGVQLITPVLTGNGRFDVATEPTVDGPLLSDIVGQDRAKRALIIAAAGGHNLFFNGPPGTGKSLLAKALASLLPPLSHEEMLEVTQLHSLSSKQYDQLATRRPVRVPHHTASHTAMVGGGSGLRPGEVSLSHRGVLFLDEFPEFSRPTLEALRQPLEDRVISLARAQETVQFPANFILAATANPCPCGYHGLGDDRCKCSQAVLSNYRRKLSGPILDRIDLNCEVYEVNHHKLLRSTDTSEDDHAHRQIATARAMQAERLGCVTRLNSDLTNRELRSFANLSRPAKLALQDAAHRCNLSARAYMRSVKVARTLADLDGSAMIHKGHITEALAYRKRTNLAMV